VVIYHGRELGASGARNKALAASKAGKHALLADGDRAVSRLVEQWFNGAGHSVVAVDRCNAAMARELLK
jgi:hypothetical protein